MLVLGLPATCIKGGSVVFVSKFLKIFIVKLPIKNGRKNRYIILTP